MADEITVRALSPEQWVRGPGGHWYKFAATDGVKIGYGQTEREARSDLASKP